MSLPEQATRKRLIDKALTEVGWTPIVPTPHRRESAIPVRAGRGYRAGAEHTRRRVEKVDQVMLARAFRGGL